MKIIHIIYSGMGGHGDVVFPKIERDKKNQYIIFLLVLKKFL